MYQNYFKLKREPFGMTPDPYCLFRTESHREALSGLSYALLEGKGFVILTGEVGTGKTTVLNRVLHFIPSTHAVFSVVLNPTLSADEFLESVLMDFGIENIPASKVHRLVRLQQFLAKTQANSRTCVLVVDEAHKLSPEVLEEIRLLTNFENAQRKLLQVVLVGQTELRTLLNREDLRQLKQRIALRFELQPLSVDEVGQYMRFRWRNAGAEEDLPFERDAIHRIGSVSRGLPRLINALCDNALMVAYGSGDACVTAAHVGQAMRDLDLGRAEEILAVPKVNGVAKSNAVAKSNGVAAADTLRLPPPSPVMAALPLRLRTLEKYIPSERKAPLLMRWAGKVRLAPVERENP